MKINLVHDGWGGWMDSYIPLLLKGFVDRGVSVLSIDISEEKDESKRADFLRGFEPPDVWFCTVFVPWLICHVLDAAGNTPVVTAYHGGSPQRLFLMHKFGEVGQEEKTLEHMERIKLMFLHTEADRRMLLDYYGDRFGDKLLVTGYPLGEEVSYGVSFSYRRGIIVPGRLDVDKQPFLAARMLEPFMESVAFYTPDDETSDEVKSLRYWGYKVVPAERPLFLEALKLVKVVFTASASESAATSIAEASVSGAMVVVPDIPCFELYPRECKYEAFSIKDARRVVQRNIGRCLFPVKYDLDWCNAERVVFRMIKGIYGCM